MATIATPTVSARCEAGLHFGCRRRVLSLLGDHDCDCSCHQPAEVRAAA